MAKQNITIVALNDNGEWASGKQLFYVLGIEKNYNVESIEELASKHGCPFASYGDDFVYFAIGSDVKQAKGALLQFAKDEGDGTEGFGTKVSVDDFMQGGGGY